MYTLHRCKTLGINIKKDFKNMCLITVCLMIKKKPFFPILGTNKMTELVLFLNILVEVPGLPTKKFTKLTCFWGDHEIK